jgi:hypothetical protein
MRSDALEDGELYSWDVFKILLEYEASRSQRYPSPLTLLGLSLEPNPNTSETIQVIQARAKQLFNSHLRSADVPAQFRDEYFILLPNTSEHGAQAVCARLLSLFTGSFHAEQTGDFFLTIHIGVTTYNGDPKISAEVILEQAGITLKNAQMQNKEILSYSEISK